MRLLRKTKTVLLIKINAELSSILAKLSAINKIDYTHV